MELVKLTRQRAVDAVYEVLRQLIVSYSIKPGERLNIEELAEKLGVSLTPVRGAIQQLSTEGLVEIRSRSGTFVARLSSQEVDETFRIRCALECLAAQEGLPNVGEKDLSKMRGLQKIMRRPVRDLANKNEHEKANSDFHRVIVDSSGNRRLMEMYIALNAHIKIARIHGSESSWPSRVMEEEAEHEAILDAIERRDETALCAALRKHIYRAKDALVRTLRELEQSQPAK